MKQTVIENTSGLWEWYPHVDVEVSVIGKYAGKRESRFYDIDTAIDTPLWGSTVTEDSPFIRPFEE